MIFLVLLPRMEHFLNPLDLFYWDRTHRKPIENTYALHDALQCLT